MGDGSGKDRIYTINDLPDEVLDYILSLLSPYRDYKNAMLVCQRWHCIMKDVAQHEYQHFHEAITEGTLWWTALPPALGPSITERYSPSACYLNKCLYVFGGCTSKNTTFNDLWKLDLGTGEWIRPLAMGTYPSPKAYASLVVHEDKLVLFGGWSHPTPLSLHQSARFFQQLHTYTPETNTWEEIITTRSPQGLAGHGATVIRDSMIIFGGSKLNGISCNDIWIFNLVESEWCMKNITGTKPLPRYGHAQTVIDDNHILVVGGCGGPNMQFNDVWLLSMETDDWRWEELTVLHPENCAPQLWCHPACRAGDKLVVLSKFSKSPGAPSSSTYSPQVRSPKVSPGTEYESTGSHRPVPTDVAVTGGYTHCCCCQEVSLVDKMNQTLRAKRRHPETSESSSQESSSDNDDGTGQGQAVQSAAARAGKSFVSRHMSSSASHRRPTSLVAGPKESSSFKAGASTDDNPTERNIFAPKGLTPEAPSPDAPEQGAMSPPALPAAPSGSPVSQSVHPGGRSGMPSIRPNAMRNRQKQLEMLKRYEERIKGQKAKESKPPHAGACCHGAGGPCKLLYPNLRRKQHPIYVHTLDLGQVLAKRTVSWLPLSDYGLDHAPEETIFYSLVEGRGELIMFGGILSDMNNMRRHAQHPQHPEVFSNTVYFLSPKKILR